jgi:adenosylhomocysteine nucleosidase
MRSTPGAELPPLLVVMALAAESDGVFEAAQVPVLYSGVGKINAAMSLTRVLHDYALERRPAPLVVNFGTAGSHHHPSGSFLSCHEFVQRDMDVRALGFALGETPFDETPARLRFDPVFTHLPAALCGSGDSFAVSPPEMPCGAVDMEAFALAKVCWHARARFACAKYVTDGADAAAATDWKQNVHKAAEAFLELYRGLVGNWS